MPTLNFSISVSGLGGTISQSIPRTADGGGNREVALPKGKAGTLSTRTDNDTGILTVASGHGITDTDTVDVYWDGGMRFGVDVTATTSTTISINVGSGDNLPIATTAIVVTKQVQVNLDIDGDALVLLSIKQKYASNLETAESHIDFQADDDSSIADIDLEANGPQVWDVTGGSANPFTGDPIAKAFASNGSSANDATLQILWLQDSTP